ncbi:MAG: hypothetical protein LBL43_00355 [Treponema sp.]|nr:hypothetical protein [Treponema sp.]
MKKLFVVLSLLVFGVLSLSGAENETGKESVLVEASNALYIDVSYLVAAIQAGGRGFGLGLGYEKAITPLFAILVGGGGMGVKLESDSGDILNYAGVDGYLHGRIYPFKSAIGKFYLDAGAGYTYISMDYLGEKTGSHIGMVGGQIGFKLIFKWHFLIEPFFGYSYSFGTLNTPSALNIDHPQLGGFRYGLLLGAAF